MFEEIGSEGYEQLKKTLKFGDIIENEWAPIGHQRRFGIVVNPRPHSIMCTDKTIFWDLLFSPDSKIKVHGNTLNDNYEKIKAAANKH